MRIITESCFDIDQEVVRIEKIQQPKMCPTCGGKAVVIFSNERGNSVGVPCFMCSGKGRLEKEKISMWKVCPETYHVKKLTCEVSPNQNDIGYTFFYQIENKQDTRIVPESELFLTRQAAELNCLEQNEKAI